MSLNSDKVFLIAEIGGNHEGDMEYARKLTDLAIQSGADAIKYQIYSPDGLVNKYIDKTRYDHFKKFTLSFEQYEQLALQCSEAGVQFMSSIWQDNAIDYFNKYIEVHKIGSGDLTNYPLLKKLSETGKPIILSTAMASLLEVHEAVKFIENANPAYKNECMLAILQCVAMYGAPKNTYANVNVLDTFKVEFPNKLIGYSDHTVGSLACEVAVAKGARILEVHFTDDKTREFRDHHIAMDLEDIRMLRLRIDSILEVNGEAVKVPIKEIETEHRIKEFRRACYLKHNYPTGTIIREEMLTCLRPCHGIPASRAFTIVGKKLSRDVKALEPLQENFFE